MIDISHPKINGKPPVKRCFAANDVVPKRIESREEDHAVLEKKNDSVDTAKGEKAERDRNVIESSSCSIEQLCSMISDLEKDAIVEIPEIDQLQLKPEKDESGPKREYNGTTYDDVMAFLAKLEEGSRDDETKTSMPDMDAAILGEIFGDSNAFPHSVGYVSIEPANIEHEISRTFSNDLAAARLELDERKATVSLLKEQLKSERKLACEKLAAQRKSSASKLQQLEAKYKGIVTRHQKFIEQLLAEKTDLTEKCNSLVQRVNEIEAKMQRDAKVTAERHEVELQRARERYAAAEKIKRERWIESRTTKIKEMTVKGLEPELRKMMEQHAEEIQRLRNGHAKELQDAELRIIRRCNAQLEQLRLESTASHERSLTNEKNALWARYQEKLAEQEKQFKEERTKLANESEYNAEKFNKELAKRDAEREANLRHMHSRYQRETEILKQQHSNEKKALQESLKTEWEIWLADYKKRQNLRIEQTENRIRDECNRDRDRQIELVIERLEKDTRATKLALRRGFDCKLRRLTEEFDMDLQAAKSNEQLHKGKLTQTMDKLEKSEVRLQQAEKKLQEYMSELNNANEVIERLSVQRDIAKRSARQEIEGEKRELEEKIASLYQEITRINANRDTSMARLHSRIKLIMTQKVLTIKALNKELSDAKSKCEHLEKMLDQQRREYILNDL